jgi:hypothetical protein
MIVQFLDTLSLCSVYESLRFRTSLFGYAIVINLVALGITALSAFVAICVLKLFKGLKVSIFLFLQRSLRFTLNLVDISTIRL